MAPFLSAHGESASSSSSSSPTPSRHTRNQHVDYSTPGSTGYNIPQNTTWNAPSNRKIRVLTIGAGISGILMAYQLQKHCENVEHVVYEKNEDVGGTWLENRYPRAGCDIPSHAYTYQFALNPDWPRFFSFAPDIWAYLNKVCETFDLKKYMRFHVEVVGCYWQEHAGEWVVKLREHLPNHEVREFEDRCNVLLYGAGVLNNFKFPDIPGLQDRFKGRVIHTARWPKDYKEEDWAKERVAVIGSGASSIQTVPGMQPYAKHLDIFVRTGVWFGVIAGNSGSQAKEYSEEERENFRRDPKAVVAHAREIEEQVNGMWGGFYAGSMGQKMGSGYFRTRMAEHIKDERLLQGFSPKFGLGCRRITPGDPYMEAIQKENVDVHFTPVESCTEKGVVGGDGVEREVDTVICATGFDVSYRPRFPVIGKDGVDLREKWDLCPESYLGLAIPDMPNFLTFIGPTWPIENGSVMAPLHSVSEYAIQLIKRMQNENIRSWVPRQDITDSFNDHVQEWIKHTVWKDDCRSWYKNNETGRVNAIWPGSSLHYQQVIERPRYEDFEIHSFNDNPWAHLGMGWTVQDRKGPKEEDVCPYFNVKNIDPKWYEACGGDSRLLVERPEESSQAGQQFLWPTGT
ncbi:flavin-binding monooxygenase-like protein [Dothistroma septosporum NZE10]|uniref:FAD-binding monooxygenase moxY n=2 Tax=Dothistroma septosporum TaxID=64363 RepID=MOXY_DOTSN|nr:RecName: Full=FAD-binding monooxygenase moxY; AltName: Full=Dothistromin biosynthesis protein moxY [Dothistroma septosporum NZE10]Q30DW9.1 RecName: Full=FAD-binding monooxygenase moxY; AltName: Full=Dothistromin biosynthesis protein moxY [Dothistroma septosporum]AAZ95013.1 putative flavin-binding monooxygenase [Dothistroma septosporum]EME38864.1 flavin-binding monooxygenase-like protein [Dothistroma septosporum NZE10]